MADYVFHAHDGEYPVNDSALPIIQTDYTRPFPSTLWRIDQSNGGYPYHDLQLGIMTYEPICGAFAGAADLAAVRIPISVKTIGPTAFKDTALQRVRIAADCTYSEQSFPSDCVVMRYPDDRYEQLYDCDGKAVLDCDGARVYVLKEESESG